MTNDLDLPYLIYFTQGQGSVIIAAFMSPLDAYEYLIKAETRGDGSYGLSFDE